MPFFHCISSFEGTSYKNFSDKTTKSFICCFTLAFISADVIHRSLFKITWKKGF